MSRRLAICVGIDAYGGDDDLAYCAADAQEVAEYLQLPEFGFETLLLKDDDATRYGILEALGIATKEPLDFFVFYFSGHGTVTDFGSYLVTSDTKPFDEGVGLEQLNLIVGRISKVARNCLLILDCCHSGAANTGSEHRPITTEDIDGEVTTRTESRTLLAACRPEQVAFEYEDLGHGLFTYVLLRGLEGEAVDVDGNITVGGLSEFIHREFEKSEINQIAVMKGDHAGRVVLATGLPPRTAQTDSEEVQRRLIAQGKQFLDDYTSQLNLRLEDWTANGYKAAAQALTPTVQWFRRRRSESAELAVNRDFSLLYSAVINKVKQLADVEVNTVIDQGTIVSRLGGGGFGTVWKVDPFAATHPALAYKIYHPMDYNVDEKQRLFMRGFRAMQQLDHPRVVKVHGFTDCPMGFFMDYIDGPSFRNLPSIIETPEEILRFLLLSGETISHAHSRGVYHRDIKPENILAVYRDEDGTWLPYLTDFDLAWFSQATQVTKQAWGNLSYAAPEQLSNPRSNSAHRGTVDIYAFGQLAFFALAGTDPTPVGRADNSRLLRERLADWPVGDAAEKFLTWYEDCTAVNPAERLESFQEVMDGLVQVELSLRDWGGASVSDERLLGEVAFSLSGFGATHIQDPDVPFTSTSARTQISLSIVGRRQSSTKNMVDIEARLTLDRITIEGVTSNERARTVLNGRIDEITKNLSGVKRRPGLQGIFETFIIVSGVTCDRAGVEYSRRALSSIIEAIER